MVNGNINQAGGLPHKMSTQPQLHWKILLKRLMPWIKFLIVAVMLVWVGMTFYHSWGDLTAHRWKFQYGWLAFSGLFYLLGYFPAAIFWHHTLGAMGQKADLPASLRAYYISQLGKYTPGKAMVVIMRADMIRGKTVRASCAAACVFLETFTLMSSGAFFAAAITLFWFRDHPEYSRFLVLNGIMLVLSCVPTIPPFFRFVAEKLGVGKGDPQMPEKMRQIRWRTVMYGWFLMIFTWTFFGLSLWGTIHGLGLQAGPITELPRYVAISAMSVVLGFVLMTPGGLGAREWVIFQCLAPIFALSPDIGSSAEAFAIAVAAAQRVISIVAEVVIGAVLMAFKPK